MRLRLRARGWRLGLVCGPFCLSCPFFRHARSPAAFDRFAQPPAPAYQTQEDTKVLGCAGARTDGFTRARAAQQAAAQADASAAASTFLTHGGLDASKATVSVTLRADAVSVHVEYASGSLTGLTDLVLPSHARATAEMRR